MNDPIYTHRLAAQRMYESFSGPTGRKLDTDAGDAAIVAALLLGSLAITEVLAEVRDALLGMPLDPLTIQQL